jgi:EpsI family protein
MIGKTRTVLILLLFAATWYVLQMTSTVNGVSIRKTLAEFPHQFDEYHLAAAFQSSADVLQLLGVDDYIQYNYLDESGDRINFYVGFYKAVGVTGSYHSPKNCLPGGGWGIDTTKKVKLKTGTGDRQNSEISEMLIRNGSDYQVVFYWYQNRGRIISSEYMEKVYLVLDAIFKGRRDGAFVRIMSVARNGDIEATEDRVKKFAETVMPLLEEYLPGASL